MNVKFHFLHLVALAAITISISITCTESYTSAYSITFTKDATKITLDSFPYDIPCVSVVVPSSLARFPCVWFVNGNHRHGYYQNKTHLLLQPFGINFTNSHVFCVVIETGKSYNLFIKSMCPCKFYGETQMREGGKQEVRG